MENQSNATVVSTKDWIITLLITCIPGIGIVMLFVWAFGSGTNPNKANYAKAALIWMAVMIVIYILIFMLFGAAMLATMGQ